jgi:hypothetical protein
LESTDAVAAATARTHLQAMKSILSLTVLGAGLAAQGLPSTTKSPRPPATAAVEAPSPAGKLATPATQVP